MVRKSEHCRTPFVSPLRGVRCRLTGSPTAPEQRQGPGALVWPRYRTDTQRAGLYRAGAPAANAAAASSRCCRLSQTILETPAPPPHNMSAAAAAVTGAASGEQIRSEPGTRGAAVAPLWPFSLNADRRSQSRGNGGPSLQKPEKVCWKPLPIPFALPEASPPHVPPSLPDRLPGVAAALPPPALAGTARFLRQRLPPAAVPARVLASRPLPGTVAGRGRASRYRGAPSTRRGFGARLGLGWVGGPARVDRRHYLLSAS